MRTHTVSIRSLRGLVALALALVLLPLAALPALAEEKPVTNLFGSRIVDMQSQITSVALAGDTLYYLTPQALFSFGPGDREAVLRAEIPEVPYNFGIGNPDEAREPQAALLLSDGQTLYTLDRDAQTLYTLDIAEGKLAFSSPLKLDMAEFIDGEPPYVYVQLPEWACIFDGRLYLKKQNYDGSPVDLYSFDLKTGEKKAHQAPNLSSACAFKDGTMLVSVYDYANSFDPETGTMRKPELAVFNPLDDSVTKLGAFLPVNENAVQVASMYYDAAEGSLYTMTDTDLVRMDGDFKTQRIVGYLPMFGNYSSMLIGGLLPLPDGRLAVTFGTNSFLRERTEKGLEGVTVLSFAGGMDDPQILQSVLMEMDNVVLRRVEGLQYNYLTPEQLASMFLTGSVNVDIMPVNAYSFDLDKLIEKGYLADLSGSQVIRDYTSHMPSGLNRAVLRGDKVYAVPVSIIVFPLSAYTKPFAALGLDIPETIPQLLALTRDWAEGLGEQHPEYMLFNDSGDMRRTMVDLVMNSYINAAFGEGRELVFDTPQFRSLMAEVEAGNFASMSMEFDWTTPEGQAAADEFFSRTTLIETGMGYEPRYNVSMNNTGDHVFKPLILPLEEGGQAFLQADFTMLAVLSGSKQIPLATEFVERYLGKLDPVSRASLDARATEPIIDKDYDKKVAESERAIAQLEQLVGRAEGAEKSNLEENLKYTREYHERLKQSGQYLATAEDLARIHEIVGKLYVMDGLMNAQRRALYDEKSPLYQYYAGAITLDQFITQMDDTLRLVRMEYQ